MNISTIQSINYIITVTCITCNLCTNYNMHIFTIHIDIQELLQKIYIV